MKRVGVVAVAALIVGSPAAEAADYPYSGRMTLTVPDAPAEQAQLYCAYNFFFQRKDGTFTGYHIDLARFRADGTVRYLVYQKGTCTLDGTTPASVESCLMSFDTDRQMQGRTFIDHYQVEPSGSVTLTYFDDFDSARAFAANGDASCPPDVQFVPCADPGGQSVDKYLTEEASTLPPADRMAVTGAEMEDAPGATMQQVLDAISAGK